MLTLADLLELPSVSRARPLIVSGEAGLARSVRWVHTSEIFEISPLLQGGEVLLTTGLGLVGRKPREISTYVENLVDKNLTALMVEVGRTFAKLPAALISSATKHGLTLIELHQVVPFVEITEVTHRLIIHREQEMANDTFTTTNRFLQLLASGASVRSIIELTSEIAGVPVTYKDSMGEVVIGTVENIRNLNTVSITEVIADGVVRGSLHFYGNSDQNVQQIGESAAQSLTVLLSRGDMPATLVRREWLLDLLASPDDPEIASPARARAAGVNIEGRTLQPILFTGIANSDRPQLLRALTEADLGVVIDLNDAVALIHRLNNIRQGEPSRRSALESTISGVTQALSAPVRQRVRVTAGDPATDLSTFGRNLRAAKNVSQINELLGGPTHVRYASELGGHQLLANEIADHTLELFVEEQIGALIDADARGGKELVITLESLARYGFSKTLAAEALGVRRQTLHNRLIKIEEILGVGAIHDPERRFSLHLAVVAWRLRISAVTLATR